MSEEEACEEDEEEQLACKDDGCSSDDDSGLGSEQEQEQHEPPPQYAAEEHEPPSQGAAEEGQPVPNKYEEVLQQMMHLPMSQFKQLVWKANDVLGWTTNELWHIMSKLPLCELETLASRASVAVKHGMSLVASSSQEGAGSGAQASGCEGSELEGGAEGSPSSLQLKCPATAAGLLMLFSKGFWHCQTCAVWEPQAYWHRETRSLARTIVKS